MKRLCVLALGMVLMVGLTTVRVGAQAIIDINEFSSGALTMGVFGSGNRFKEGCLHFQSTASHSYSDACALWPKWAKNGAHPRQSPSTLRAFFARHVQDDSYSHCIADTTTIYRYRLNSATPAVGSNCVAGNAETLRATRVFSRSTCSDVSLLRNDGESFWFDFASETDVVSSTYRYYRERMIIDNSGLSETFDGCYQIFWSGF